MVCSRISRVHFLVKVVWSLIIDQSWKKPLKDRKKKCTVSVWRTELFIPWRVEVLTWTLQVNQLLWRHLFYYLLLPKTLSLWLGLFVAELSFFTFHLSTQSRIVTAKQEKLSRLKLPENVLKTNLLIHCFKNLAIFSNYSRIFFWNSTR